MKVDGGPCTYMTLDSHAGRPPSVPRKQISIDRAAPLLVLWVYSPRRNAPIRGRFRAAFVSDPRVTGYMDYGRHSWRSRALAWAAHLL